METYTYAHALACLDYLKEQALVGVKQTADGDAEDVNDNAKVIYDLLIKISRERK